MTRQLPKSMPAGQIAVDHSIRVIGTRGPSIAPDEVLMKP